MIGEKIRKVRIIRGYSQEYVSDKLNISQPAYSDIEKNKTKITLETIQEIAKLFEIELSDLLNFDENQVFNNTLNVFNNNLNENSQCSFNVQKVFNDNFDREREVYNDQIKTLKEEILYLRKKLDEK